MFVRSSSQGLSYRIGHSLVVDAGDLLSVPADGDERLLEVVRADVERQEVEA